MGVELAIYRAAVGLFYTITHTRLNLPRSCWNLRLLIQSAKTSVVLLFLRCFIKNDPFTLYRLILLLIAMDIELNPGPSITDVNSLEIFHVNARSIRNKLDYICDITDTFNVLCFSETHLDNSVQSETLILNGYDVPIRKDRTRNGGGVMVYVSNLLRYKRREDLEDQILETIWTEIKLRSFNILLCCFYRSDFNVSQSTFINELQSSIEVALDYTPYVILTGDINIDFINLTNSQLCYFLSLFNLTNVIKEPTRISANSITLIDPMLVSDAGCVLDSGIISVDELVSDHKATHLSVKIPIRLSNCYYREVWNYKNADNDLLNELIDSYDWDLDINNSLIVDEACVKFTNTFSIFCKSCIPSKKVLIRPNDKPWFTSELRYNIR